MPKVTITSSYEGEEFGRAEVSTFSREVDDLDPQDFLWFMMKATEMVGFDLKDIHFVTKTGELYTTDI